MIKVFNILSNNNQPILNVQKEIDVDGNNMSIEETVEILNEYLNMNCLNIEHAYLIGFDNNMNIVGIFLISIGTYNKCFFYGRNIATFLILSGSERFILYHNHPNGDLNISDNDQTSLINVKLLANILEIEFIDSVIISNNGWRCIERGDIYEYDKDDEFQ